MIRRIFPVLLLLLLSVVTSCRDDSERARSALQALEEYYVEHKAVNDSLETITYDYFLVQDRGTASEQDRARLMHAASIWDTDDVTSLQMLLPINDDHLSSTYFTGVRHYLLGSIFFMKGLYNDAIREYRKELEISYEEREGQKIATSMAHLAMTFDQQDLLDSTFFYLKQALRYEQEADSAFKSVLYNNMGYFYERSFPDSLRQTERYYEQAVHYDPQSYTSKANLVNIYLLQHKTEVADSLVNVIQTTNQENNAFTVLYEGLRDHFERVGMADSVLKYERLRAHYDSLTHQPEQQQVIVRSLERHQAGIGFEYLRHYYRIYIIALLLLITVIISALVILHKKGKNKQSTMESNIRSIQNDLDYAEKKAKKLTDKVKRLNTQLENKSSLIDKIQKENQENTAMLQKFNNSLIAKRYLPSHTDQDITPQTYYQAIIELFIQDPKHEKDYKSLINACPKMSIRDQALCILISEQQHTNKEICKLLDFISENAYKMAKSRLRKTLTNTPSESTFVQHILSLL